MDTTRWEDKVTLVSGGGSGLGLACAEAFARRGSAVVLTDIRAEAAERAAQDIRAHGGRAEAFSADAASEADWRQLFDTLAKRGQPVDILINNAGRQHVEALDTFPLATFQDMLALMVVGPFVSMQLALPHMRATGWGRIINMASVNGLVGFAGKAAYNTAKHGLIGLTRVAALEVAEAGITVNALCPGYVETPLVRNQLESLAATRGVPVERVLEDVIYPLVPQRRLLEPDEVAEYAVFLASEQGRSITGQAVVMDGGYVAQ